MKEHGQAPMRQFKSVLRIWDLSTFISDTRMAHLRSRHRFYQKAFMILGHQDLCATPFPYIIGKLIQYIS